MNKTILGLFMIASAVGMLVTALAFFSQARINDELKLELRRLRSECQPCPKVPSP